jgi:hypothetical protein
MINLAVQREKLFRRRRRLEVWAKKNHLRDFLRIPLPQILTESQSVWKKIINWFKGILWKKDNDKK